ncbi:hypothetical protein B296_00001053 [Ensete ventricosum]|uniref:Peptidase A2 domain-containing protein n=1 Tax=Ensete ventricosum TaxID=4639 RepID=A0A427AYT0_ENSVE|nr:hypothetical protein B296_00001053 [Ensete ventricosum]
MVFPQMASPVALNHETQLETKPPQCQVAEAHAASSTAAPTRSQSRSCDPVQIGPDPDTLSSDTTDSLREQVRQVHQRLDEVQKEVLKSRGEIKEKAIKAVLRSLPRYKANLSRPPLDLRPSSLTMAAAIRQSTALHSCTPQTDHRLPHGVGPRERRAPLPVCGTVHLTGPRNSRSPSIPSHPGILDRTETIEVLLVIDRATARNATRDATTGASIHGRRDVGCRQAGRDEAPPSGAASGTPPTATKEEGGQVGHVAIKTPLIPLNSTRTEIFFQIREKGLLKAPNPMKSHSERRNKRRYYRFHREYDHDTEECRDLQYQIEDLIWRGHMRRYVRDQSSLPDSRPPRDSSPRPKGPVKKQIDIIFRGPASGGDSSSARKAYTRFEVRKRPAHDEDLDITFKSGGEEYPCHDDALVISIRMANAYVKRVMIDTGSSADILYINAFQKLGLTDKDLVTLTSTLTGFTGDFVSPLGATTIPVTFRGEPRSKTLMVSFIVVKLPSAYNAIIGRPTLNRFKAVISTYH